jgi:Holliday junction resolvasome RuvABC endonuclease subunit
MTKFHVAFDASSTSIGWVLARDGKRRFSGTEKLKGKKIEERVEQAYQFTLNLLTQWPGAELLVTEAPGVRFVKGAIPQLRVSGAIILAARHKGIPWRETTPTQAKKALTGKGSAKKPDVIAAAAPHLGYDPAKLVIRGSKSTPYRAYIDNRVVYDEHEADAVAVMVAAWNGDLVEV